MQRKNIAILFGGRSVEHEISVITAREALGAVDTLRYNPIPVYVTREGRWMCGPVLRDLMLGDNYRRIFARDAVKTQLEALLDEVVLLPKPGVGGLVKLGRNGVPLSGKKALVPVDVLFPAFHGTYGEDGCMQGLFELSDIAYAGCNPLASSIGMHKHLAKGLLLAGGVDSLPGLLVHKDEMKNLDALMRRIAGKIPTPLFVKPCNLGSSVGISEISIVNSEERLPETLSYVFRYDESAIIEPYLTTLRELQVAVCEGKTIHVSAVEAPKVKGVNTAAAKYGTNMLNAGTKNVRDAGLFSSSREFDPQDVDPAVLDLVRCSGKRVYDILGCGGVVRVDFFYDTKANKLYFNEINTLPGSLSYFLYERRDPPMLFTVLIDEIIHSALRCHAQRDNFNRTYVF
jgi:D-alanine-D-alanine ligase